MIFINIFLFFLPSIIGTPIRRALGFKIGKNTTISIATYISSKYIYIGENVIIQPFVFINSTILKIDKNTTINPLSILKSRFINIGQNTKVSSLVIIHGALTPNSYFSIGNHSGIFPFAWIDTSEGVYIGNHVGIGGHTLIFTHGTWANYLKGGSVTFGSVYIEDHVWLAWRVFIMPGVKIGKYSIVSANSTLFNSFPNNTLISGTPARTFSNNAYQELNDESIVFRLDEILFDFVRSNKNLNFTFKSGCIFNNDFVITSDLLYNTFNNTIYLHIFDKNTIHFNLLLEKNKMVIDLINLKSYNTNNIIAKTFLTFVRKYGIRIN